MTDSQICPFSKPIIGQYCQCPHAIVAERCSGKMSCAREAELLDSCSSLVDIFRQKAHFVLSISSADEELTHAQTMKIRCGGLLGMQRVMQMNIDSPPAIRELMQEAKSRYGKLGAFPFSEIMPDIQEFNHRRKIRKTT